MSKATYTYRKSNANLYGRNCREDAIERAKFESTHDGHLWYVFGGPTGWNGRDFTGSSYTATRVKPEGVRATIISYGEYYGSLAMSGEITRYQ